jgi:hypothetical protein
MGKSAHRMEFTQDCICARKSVEII